MRQSPFRLDRLAVVGVGLIGGSLALALREARAVGEVWGVGRSQANLEEALARGIIDRVVSLEEAAQAELVFIATPVAQMPAVFRALRPHLSPATILTDGGSTKRDVIAAARAELGSAFPRFVPGHPIAGTEKTGAAAAFATLYRERKVVLCPEAETDPRAMAEVAAMWRATGANVHELSAAEHDDVFAAVSHLPHLLAFALVDMLAEAPAAERYFAYAASGFRDFTRIAAGSPEMWRDITLANRDAIRAQLAAYRARLDAFDAWLAAGNPPAQSAIEGAFTRAAQARRAWQRMIEHGEPMPPL
ncbi:MAG: prephenate dehydrogenase/arogenate dehydrogenase family protein, partial [Casimicrobiaceae bacterium]|nr:prephenate dehydrogenase/arogenate dehydrogenase family protein [Casimicrobiaceae bacterium]MDW8312391.1 prephenate dehydrogenase/arogenate dehydrogenase family protein [Burkholderiales bacterium]